MARNEDFRRLQAIERRRALAELSVRELANMTGISRNRLAALLSGPKQRELDELDHALDSVLVRGA